MSGKSSYLFGFLLSICVLSTNGSFRCDYTYHNGIDGWLKVHRIPMTFKEAFFRCDYEGAVLASPLDDRLQKALMSVHPKQKDCGMYTGIHSTLSHGDYNSVEGIPLARIPVKWAPNEPDNFGDAENCLIMLRDGTLADVACNETFPFACYKKKTENMVMTECGTTDTAYKLDKRTGSCYKFHRYAMSWRRANMICSAEGGHLAVINSPLEATVLKDVFAENPAKDLIDAHYNDVASIGFYDTGTEGLWYTVHGQRLQDSGYFTWGQGQPDNTTYNRFRCGGFFRSSGQLDDVWCDGVKLAFICEMAPNSLTSQ